jgi:hypothetical protein
LIQWELLRKLSSNPNNTVIGIVRNKPPTDKRGAEELSPRHNITISNADVTKYNELTVSGTCLPTETVLEIFELLTLIFLPGCRC